MLVDDGSVVDIIYLDAYKKMDLIETELSPGTSPLYGFTEDHIIPKGTIKLAVTVGEHPKVLTIMAEFLVVDSPSAVNGIIKRPLLKALKAVTSIHRSTMKFPTAEGRGQVWGSQYDSKEYYNKSFKLAEKEGKLSRKIDVGGVSVRSKENLYL